MQAPQQPKPLAAAQAGSKPDPYYGHKNTARLCARFITHLFVCPEYPPTSSGSNTDLRYFIAYALHRTKLHSSVAFTVLVLLQCLKAQFPTAHGLSGHCLFISAFMIAWKVICDDTYSNKSWSIVGQGCSSFAKSTRWSARCANISKHTEWVKPIIECVVSKHRVYGI